MPDPAPREMLLAVLISGGGTTLRNLIEYQNRGLLQARIRLVISSRPDARGLDFARQAGIESLVFDHRRLPAAEQISPPIFAACRERDIELVVCAGFLRRLDIPADFSGRVINIHPSLLPSHGGAGMYGLNVHRSVLDSGQSLSGCTVHFVDNQYDQGPVIARQQVAVVPGDSPQSLAARVFLAECEIYPAVIRSLALGELPFPPKPVPPSGLAGGGAE